MYAVAVVELWRSCILIRRIHGQAPELWSHGVNKELDM